MAIGDLSQIEILYVYYTIINVTFSIIIGLRISSKYILYKRKELLTVGLSIVFTSAAWWSSIIAFLTIVFLNYEPGLQFYLAFHLIVPLALLFWIYSISILLYPKSLKKIMLIFLVICILYDLFLGIFIIIDPSSLGRRIGKILGESYLYISTFLLFSLIVVIITNILFLKNCLKAGDPKARWRGIFIFSAMIIFVFTGVITIITNITPFALIYIIGNIFSYIGWLMPKKISTLLIKESPK